MDINFVKLHKDAITPSQAHPGDAGYDLYAVEDCKIRPMERKIIKTGIAARIPYGYYGRIAPRSGLAVKNGIDVMAGVVDHQFSDSIGVVLINLNFNLNDLLNPANGIAGSSLDFRINKGDRIAQLIIEKCHDVNWVQIEKLDETQRGTTGYGASGT